ncbi:type IV pilin protein [Methylobacter tundripaludum]|uniref:type IV pilin protein n=1 Tax=Methylobacter tundripaludum TaxID=173365 RepID=UPI000480606D|nr:type IV pilin protein [Methylobacter tundripaludum]
MTKQQAFTLIELMVTVAIVGILAGIAYPSYQDSVMKSRRADAKGALLGFANAMERHFTETNSYLGAGTTNGNTGIPTVFSATSPVDGGTAYYNLTINAATAGSYTLNAAPTGAQTNDKCGTLSLTQTGARGISTAIPVTDCW